MPETRTIPQSKELSLLEELGRERRLSQRELAQRLGVSVGFLNRCLQQLVENGYVRVADRSVRPFAYRVTREGEQYRQALKYDDYEHVVARYLEVEQRIRRRLGALRRRGIRRVVCYGAGEILDVALTSARAVGLEVAGAVDDDVRKQGTRRDDVRILAPSALAELDPEAVIITTFRHARLIRERIGEISASYVAVEL